MNEVVTEIEEKNEVVSISRYPHGKDRLTAEGEMIKLEKFLENNKTNNQTDPWSKLDKTMRMRKLTTYAIKYTEENNLSAEEAILLLTFLKECLDRKKFQRVKDVEYNKVTGSVISIPSMLYTKTAKHFTLKNVDKRVSTLKGLPPKRHNCSKKCDILAPEDDDM